MGSTTNDNELQRKNFGYKPLTNEWIDFGELAVPRRFGDAFVYNGQLKQSDL